MKWYVISTVLLIMSDFAKKLDLGLEGLASDLMVHKLSQSYVDELSLIEDTCLFMSIRLPSSGATKTLPILKQKEISWKLLRFDSIAFILNRASFCLCQ